MAEVEHVAEETVAAGNAVGDAPGHVTHLAGVELVHPPFGVVGGMSAVLEPDLVVVHAPVKAVLLSLGVVRIGAEVFALVLLRTRSSALAGHSGEVVEHAHHRDLAAFAPLEGDATHELGVVALDDDGLQRRVPEIGHFEYPALARRNRHRWRVGRFALGASAELRFRQWIVRVQGRSDRLVDLDHQLPAARRAEHAVRHARGQVHGMAGRQVVLAVFRFRGRVSGELEHQHVVIGRAVKDRLRAVQGMGLDDAVLSLPQHRRPHPLQACGALDQVEGFDPGHRPSAAALRADQRLFVPLEPDGPG